MSSNHKASPASDEPAAIEASPASAPVDEVNVNFDDYVASANIPICAAPVKPSTSFPVMLYGKGVTVVSGQRPYKTTAYLLQTEQSAEVDNLFEREGATSVRIRHYNKTEDVYWLLPSIKGYFLFTAIPDEYGPETWKTGIPYVWNPYKGTYSFGSQLQCLFFSKGLMQWGYQRPLVLSLSRTVTKQFVNCVLRPQEAFVNTIANARKKHGLNGDLGIYAYWCELMVGDEFSTINGGSYNAPGIALPNPYTVAYAREHESSQEHIEIIESFLPILPMWAEEASAQLLAPPRDNNGKDAPLTEAPPEQESAPEAE